MSKWFKFSIQNIKAVCSFLDIDWDEYGIIKIEKVTK